MDKIELPNQLVAILADPLLQKLLILHPDANSDRRIANWLNAVLEDVIQGDADQDTLWEVLEVIKQYVEQTKVNGYRTNVLSTHLPFPMTDASDNSSQFLCQIPTALGRERRPYHGI